MEVTVKYKGRRADELKKYNAPYMRGGPYDFSKGACKMDEKDADALIDKNPIAFEILAPKAPKAPAPPKGPDGGDGGTGGDDDDDKKTGPTETTGPTK